MKINKITPLTETTFFVMLSFMEPLHGYAVMRRVEDLSRGRVRIAAGTMYGITDNLLKQKMIHEIPSSDPRRRVYQLTPFGRETLGLEIGRLKELAEVAEQEMK